MPPLPHWYAGIEAVTDFAARMPLSTCGSWRHVPVTANGQAAVAQYLDGRAWAITVLTVRDERIADITSFLGAGHFAAFGLPVTGPVGPYALPGAGSAVRSGAAGAGPAVEDGA
jgi:RNA polymerase sigma-70 factor (ECF subfamily)